MVTKSSASNAATNNGLGKFSDRTYDVASSGHNPAKKLPNPSDRRRYLCLALVALVYALLAGYRTLTDTDLGWQLATGRWMFQHHEIPSVDVFSFTAAGQPWIYPVGSGLVFYAVYSIGNYALLSCLGAAACVGTVALVLRRGSWVTAALAILVVPRIALRTIPRAEIFSVVLFAAFLTLLWEHYETGRSRLWLLPLIMVAWVNLHLGLSAGLALLIGYILLECLEMVWREHRQRAIGNLRRAWPWVLATIVATLVNPWGWGVFAATRNLMTPMTNRSLLIDEWGPVRLEWRGVLSGLSLHNYDSTVILILAVAVVVPLALLRRQLGAAVWLCGAAFLGLRHGRLLIFFAILVVVIAGSVFNSALASLQARISDARMYSILIGGVCSMIVVAACIWSTDLVTSRSYMRRAGTYGMASFGTGLSWWFPEGAAAFIERERIPAQLFNTYMEGGYIVWRLGKNYKDYVDGRGDPFGPELIQRGFELTQTPPDSPEWQREAEHYDINAIIVPLARYWGVEHFPVLRQFCVSNIWRPVYIDESAAVFVRRTSATENLIARLQINCDTAPIPAVVPIQNDAKSFNQWANAAAVLNALGRTPEALNATAKAIAIFPDCGSLRFTRADLLEKLGDLNDAEQEYLASASLAPDSANWARLAKLYEQEHKIPQAIAAWTREIELSTDHTFVPLLSIGFEYLNTNQAPQALDAFDRAQADFQKEKGSGIELHKEFYATLAHGRAMARRALGDIEAAVELEQEAVRLAPERLDDWLELGALYDLQGRPSDADRARKRAAQLSVRQSSGAREDDQN